MADPIWGPHAPAGVELRDLRTPGTGDFTDDSGSGGDFGQPDAADPLVEDFGDPAPAAPEPDIAPPPELPDLARPQVKVGDEAFTEEGAPQVKVGGEAFTDTPQASPEAGDYTAGLSGPALAAHLQRIAAWAGPGAARQERDRIANLRKGAAASAAGSAGEIKPWGAVGGFKPTHAQRQLDEHQAKGGGPIDAGIYQQALRDREAQEAGDPYDVRVSPAEGDYLWKLASDGIRLPPGPRRDAAVNEAFQHYVSSHLQTKQRRLAYEKMTAEHRMKEGAKADQAATDAAAREARDAAKFKNDEERAKTKADQDAEKHRWLKEDRAAAAAGKTGGKGSSSRSPAGTLTAHEQIGLQGQAQKAVQDEHKANQAAIASGKMKAEDVPEAMRTPRGRAEEALDRYETKAMPFLIKPDKQEAYHGLMAQIGLDDHGGLDLRHAASEHLERLQQALKSPTDVGMFSKKAVKLRQDVYDELQKRRQGVYQAK